MPPPYRPEAPFVMFKPEMADTGPADHMEDTAGVVGLAGHRHHRHLLAGDHARGGDPGHRPVAQFRDPAPLN